MSARHTLLLALGLAFAACDSSERPEPTDGPGRFELTVTGDTRLTFGGDARFVEVGVLVQSLDLLLDDDELVGDVFIYLYGERGPLAPGRYAFDDRLRLSENPPETLDSVSLAFLIIEQDGPDLEYWTRSGELVVTSSDSTNIRGTISFLGAMQEDTTRTVEVSGAFWATDN